MKAFKEVVLKILSAAEDKGFELPFVIDITDGDGQAMSYAMSKDWSITALQSGETTMAYPVSVVLSDSNGRALEFDLPSQKEQAGRTGAN